MVALLQCPAQFVTLTGFTLEQLPTDMSSSSLWSSQTLRTLPETHSNTQRKGYVLKQWSVQPNGLELFKLVTLLTYKICNILLHQLSQCPRGGRHASSCVCYFRDVCDYLYLMKKANILNRFTIQGVKRRANLFDLRNLVKPILMGLTDVLHTLIIRGNIRFVDLVREVDSRWDIPTSHLLPVVYQQMAYASNCHDGFIGLII